MLRFYPSSVHVVNQFRRLCGQHVGITESQIVQVAQAKHAPRVQTMTARMPNYHKILLGGHTEIQYHLAGYGVYREEALVRLLGEAIERYALFAAAATVKKRLFKASYNDLKSESDVMPWELINIFTQKDYEKMRGKLIFRRITPDDQISWMWCPSLFNPPAYLHTSPVSVYRRAVRQRNSIHYILFQGLRQPHQSKTGAAKCPA